MRYCFKNSTYNSSQSQSFTKTRIPGRLQRNSNWTWGSLEDAIHSFSFTVTNAPCGQLQDCTTLVISHLSRKARLTQNFPSWRALVSLPGGYLWSKAASLQSLTAGRRETMSQHLRPLQWREIWADSHLFIYIKWAIINNAAILKNPNWKVIHNFSLHRNIP